MVVAEVSVLFLILLLLSLHFLPLRLATETLPWDPGLSIPLLMGLQVFFATLGTLEISSQRLLDFELKSHRAGARISLAVALAVGCLSWLLLH
jgi:uncharacterized membrane protein YbhN (UPF0104 family)